MSCSFWIRRKRLAAKKAAETVKQAEKAEPTTTGEQAESPAPPKEKAGKRNAGKRTGRKPKIGNTVN